MTPEQTHQMVILCNMILVEEPLLAIGAHVRAMLAAERAAVVEECAKVCEALWESAGDTTTVTPQRLCAFAIRKLGEKK